MANDITTPPEEPDDAAGRWRSDSETIERRDREHVELVTSGAPAEQERQSNKRDAPGEPALPEGSR